MPKRVVFFCHHTTRTFGQFSCTDYEHFLKISRESVCACVNRWKISEFLRRVFTGPQNIWKWVLPMVFVIGYSSNGTISAPSQTVTAKRIAPNICQGRPPTFGSHSSRFHPNRFTFGGVIAERMKAVLFAHRVFAWFSSKTLEANNISQSCCHQY